MKTLGTTHRGKTKITSKKEIRYLFAKKLPFTLITKNKKGKTVKKRMNTK